MRYCTVFHNARPLDDPQVAVTLLKSALLLGALNF